MLVGARLAAQVTTGDVSGRFSEALAGDAKRLPCRSYLGYAMQIRFRLRRRELHIHRLLNAGKYTVTIAVLGIKSRSTLTLSTGERAPSTLCGSWANLPRDCQRGRPSPALQGDSSVARSPAPGTGGRICMNGRN